MTLERFDISTNRYPLDDFEFGYDEYCGPPIGILKCEKFEILNLRPSPKKHDKKQSQKAGKQQTLFDASP